MDGPAPLTPTEIASLLRSSGGAIESEVRAASLDLLSWRPSPEAWCIKEVLGHVIEADRRGFSGRVRELLERDGRELAAWDQDEVERARHDRDRDARELLEEFRSVREPGLQILERLSAADLSRSGRHPKVGDLSIGDVINEWMHHDRNHLKQILSNSQTYVWPHMGAAQGFSGS
jgi:hypothetical protein